MTEEEKKIVAALLESNKKMTFKDFFTVLIAICDKYMETIEKNVDVKNSKIACEIATSFYESLIQSLVYTLYSQEFGITEDFKKATKNLADREEHVA